VRVFDVFDADGKQLAIFLADLYARPSKRGGAWMNSYVDQSELFGTLPVVANHLNIPKPAAGQPTLLTWDEVTTLYHEFRPRPARHAVGREVPVLQRHQRAA
jgi:peptidyl-dipeptidase Dcp